MTDLINDILNKNTPSDEELDDFKNKLNEWVKMQIQVDRLNIAIKERKKMQQALDLYIKEFMFRFNYKDINIDNCKITARKKEYLVPITVNDMKKNILDNSELKGTQLIEFIFNSEKREKRSKESIKRILPKISNIVL
jgi:hypothetical protein